MSYPQQPRGYGMPMPPNQYPSQYPGYGQQQPRQPSYPSSNQQTPYPTSTPPYPVPPTSTSSSAAPYPTTGVQNISLSYSTPTSTAASSSEMDSWVENSTQALLSLIKDAPKSELEHFINNEDRIIDLVQDTEGVKNFQQKREGLISDNKDLAVTNLSMEPEITQLREELMRLAHQQNELKEKYTKLKDEIGGKVSLDSMLAVLQAEASQSEIESEKISDEFISSDEATENIDLFMETFMNKRIEYQIRKVKAEKMTHLITQRNPHPQHNINTPSIPPRQPVAAPRRPMAMPAPGAGYGYGGY